MSPPSPPDPIGAGLSPQVQHLPLLFVDRSLGRVRLPAILRAHGLALITLAEHYGIPHDEKVADTVWLRDSARLGWVALMKDQKIRYRKAEKDAIRDNGARCFCITSGNLTSEQAAGRYLDNINAIVRACQQPGPFIYAVHATRIDRIALGDG